METQSKNKWEISIIELEDNECKKYKVTRRLSGLLVAETKILGLKKKQKNNLMSG